jgi:hypothetical protein
MDDRDIAVGYAANFVAKALVVLVECLEKQGALGERQYESALYKVVEAHGAPRDRLDYQLLLALLEALEGRSPISPCEIDAVH